MNYDVIKVEKFQNFSYLFNFKNKYINRKVFKKQTLFILCTFPLQLCLRGFIASWRSQSKKNAILGIKIKNIGNTTLYKNTSIHNMHQCANFFFLSYDVIKIEKFQNFTYRFNFKNKYIIRKVFQKQILFIRYTFSIQLVLRGFKASWRSQNQKNAILGMKMIKYQKHYSKQKYLKCQDTPVRKVSKVYDNFQKS